MLLCCILLVIFGRNFAALSPILYATGKYLRQNNWSVLERFHRLCSGSCFHTVLLRCFSLKNGIIGCVFLSGNVS